MPWEVSAQSTLSPPHPVFDVGTDIVSETPSVAGYANAVIWVEGAGTTRATGLLFDLDLGAQKAKTPAQLEKLAAQGAFPAEFAWVQRGRHEWFLYDTNHDGRFDVILFRAEAVVAAMRVDDKGRVTSAPELLKGPLVRPELFADPKLKAALTALAPVYFIGDSLLP